MAEEKKPPAKVEEGKLAKVGTWFKTLPARIAKPFKNMVAELKKVTWPSKKRLISSSIMVLVFMLFMGVVIGLLDLAATTGVRALVGVNDVAVVEEDDHDHEAEEAIDGAVEATEVPTEATEAPVAE